MDLTESLWRTKTVTNSTIVIMGKP
ncbi:hypothetical protein O3G_MSEX001172 [Manduca sexta]|nr:hypothetical protein O3G_MSEX001172 [Manduca sexta]